MQALWNSLKSYCGFREAEPEVDIRYLEWRNHRNGHWEFTGDHLWGDEDLPDYNNHAFKCTKCHYCRYISIA